MIERFLDPLEYAHRLDKELYHTPLLPSHVVFSGQSVKTRNLMFERKGSLVQDSPLSRKNKTRSFSSHFVISHILTHRKKPNKRSQRKVHAVTTIFRV